MGIAILKHKETIEALLNQCHPTTGEICKDPILAEPEVQEALAKVLDLIDESTSESSTSLKKRLLTDKKIREVRELLQQHGLGNTSSMVTAFFLGSNGKQLQKVSAFQGYGSILKADRNKLRVEIDEFFQMHIQEDKIPDISEHPFFNKDVYNHLSEVAKVRLKEKIQQIGIVRKKGELSPALHKIRQLHPRSHEPWSEKELDLLHTALAFTNDLTFLSEKFQRGPQAIYIKAILFIDPEGVKTSSE